MITVCAGLHFDPLTTIPRVQLTDKLAMGCSWPVSTARGTSESKNENTKKFSTSDSSQLINEFYLPSILERGPVTLFSLPDHFHSNTVVSCDPEPIRPSPLLPWRPSSGEKPTQVTIPLCPNTL